MTVRPATTDLLGQAAFPSIADYGFLSDCETTALVAPSGNVEWLCLPRIDSPSVFGAILDRDAGGFRLGPDDMLVPTDRRYLPGTNILETSWGTSTGWIIVRDVLLMGPWHHEDELSGTHRRAPTDYDAEHVLLRMIRCVNGEVQVSMQCEPQFDYGRRAAHWSYTDRGYHEGRATAPGIDLQLRLTTDMRIGFEGPRAIARTLLKQGDLRYVALSWSQHDPPYTYDEAYGRLVWTAHHWQHWLARGNFPDHGWRRHLERSALTLKGLTFAPTGALVAAATTSLPETPGGERNWDYRYTWIRDTTFALWALYTLGFDWEANDFFWFVADVAERDEELQVMYGVGGERDLEERILEHLSGYGGARPVRIGNGAAEQKQHDVWGAFLDSVLIHTKTRDHLDDRMWPILCRQVEAALDHWREPDRGLWEVRGEPKHFTSSKVMCWVAADRGARLARIRDELDLAAVWQAAADEIKADVLAHGVDERGVFTQHYDTKAPRRLGAPRAPRRFPPSGRPAGQGDGPRHRRRALRGRPRVALPRQGDRRRALGRGGQLHDLFVLVGLRPRRDRRGQLGARVVRQAALLRQPARPVRRGDRPPERAAPRQLPPGLHAPGADQRRHPCHRGDELIGAGQGHP